MQDFAQVKARNVTGNERQKLQLGRRHFGFDTNVYRMIKKVLNTRVAMMNTGAPWWRKCLQLSTAKIWQKLRVALQFGAH